MSDLQRLIDITVQKPGDKLDFDSIAPAAQRLGIDPYFLQAVILTETRGDGFSDEGKAIICYEQHVFSRLTAHQYDKAYPSISNKKFYWPRKGEDHPYNSTQSERWGLLEFAASIDYEAAIQATSFGLFQILGLNYTRCGCESPAQFLESMHVSEQHQFQLFLSFIQNFDCLEPLQKGDALAFALRYNLGKDWRNPVTYNSPPTDAKKYALRMKTKYDNLKPRSFV